MRRNKMPSDKEKQRPIKMQLRRERESRHEWITKEKKEKRNDKTNGKITVNKMRRKVILKKKCN